MLKQAVEGNLQTGKPVRKLGVQKEELVEDKGRTIKANVEKCHKKPVCIFLFFN